MELKKLKNWKILLSQKKAVRGISMSLPSTPCRPLFRHLGVLTVYATFALKAILRVHKHKDQHLRHGDVHCHDTRSASRLVQPPGRLAATEFIRVPMRLYNCLKEEHRKLSGRVLKKVVKSHLVQNPPYSMTEVYEVLQQIWQFSVWTCFCASDVW